MNAGPRNRPQRLVRSRHLLQAAAPIARRCGERVNVWVTISVEARAPRTQAEPS